MLRLFVLLLLLANAGYYAWSHGWLLGLGLAPTTDAEPQRLQEQLHPERLQLLDRHAAQEAARPATPPTPSPAPEEAGAPTACLQAGPLEARQADALRPLLADWPAGSWSLEASTAPGRWMVYLGKLADDDAVARKRAELRALKVEFDRPGAAFEPGLSLGRFSSEEAAQRSLKALNGQGVKTARVVRERAEETRYQLRLPVLDEALRARLAPLAPALADKTLTDCD